jgi:hypothetical protein
MEPSVSRSLRFGVSLAAMGFLFAGTVAQAATPSPNTGSLGSSANGSNADTVTSGPGAVAAGGDSAAVYNGVAGTNTTVPFLSALNPAASNPFTIEFWARPTGSDNDDSPVSNRVSSGNRTGWVFFQRDAGTGWNFRMYNGVGSGLGWDLTGGAAPLNTWSHVAVTWNGSAAELFVNGVSADTSNDPGATGVYNVNSSVSQNAQLFMAATDSGSPYAGSVDEVAFYNSALTPAQLANHFATASSPTAGAYHTLIRNDGALLQLSNNVPEPSSMMLLGAAGMALLHRRRGQHR